VGIILCIVRYNLDFYVLCR